jgi:hypothetical protein
MPLIKSASKKVVGENIAREVAAGKPRRQAIAIALDVQRRAKKAAGGEVGMPFAARSMARSMERSGLIRSPVAGRTDRLPMSVKSGSYVVPAAAVSAIGQGNTMSGAAALNKMFGTAPGGATMPRPRGMKMPTGGMMRGRRGFSDGGIVDDPSAEPVDIVTAGGEYLVEPEIVMQIGGGDLKMGHEILDGMVKQIMKKLARTIPKLAPPKKS